MSTVLSGPRPALTTLSEDEALFRDAVREFAEAELAPRASAMDQAQAMDLDLLPMLFEMGLMGIEIPEHLGGAGSTFFVSVLIVEELSRVDPAVGVLAVPTASPRRAAGPTPLPCRAAPTRTGTTG